MKAENKIKATIASVEDFISTVDNDQKRKDSLWILDKMQKATGIKPKMWGTSLIGFGEIVVKSPTSGREVDWFIIGFSPRKANLSLYLNSKLIHSSPSMKKLGKYKTGAGCLYINKLDDVDTNVLAELIKESAQAK